jgi:hypothetical protein
MPHPLEELYGLTAEELLSALNNRFRAKVALEGAVAEVQLGKQIQGLHEKDIIERYEEHDIDGYPDFSIWLSGRKEAIRIETKNVRDANEAYRFKGQIIGYKVEVQKTRAATGDSSSRFYSADLFEILAVCLGKKTGNWTDFLFVKTTDLSRHLVHPHKIAVMHRVPLSGTENIIPWFSSLEELLSTM